MKESEALTILRLDWYLYDLRQLPGGLKHIWACPHCRRLRASLTCHSKRGWQLSWERTEWLEAHLLAQLALHQV